MDTIHIALAFCDQSGTYARHAAVTVASIFDNTKSKVCVHILHDETLTENNREQLSRLASSFNQEINFIDISSEMKVFMVKELEKFTNGPERGMLFRLLMPKLISEPKAIYMDCDVIVDMDIRELWEIDLQTKSLAVVLDVWTLDYIEKGTKLSKRLAMLWDSMNIPHNSYFNSGVLLMNLDKLRQDYDLCSSVITFFREFNKIVLLPDQDYLNYLFVEDRVVIDERFNSIRTNNITKDNYKNKIWHLAGGAKSYRVYSRPYVDELYWKYFALTPYCPDRETLIHTIMTDLSSKKYTHLHSSDCVKRIKEQIYENVFKGHIWLVIPMFFENITRKLRGRK
ncbi:MAG: glycosyltransferase family 8 protein [Synergistaceae bacterium]